MTQKHRSPPVPKFLQAADNGFIKASEDAWVALAFESAQLLALLPDEIAQVSRTRTSQASSKDCWPRLAVLEAVWIPSHHNTAFKEKPKHNYPDIEQHPRFRGGNHEGSAKRCPGQSQQICPPSTLHHHLHLQLNRT